MPASDGATYYCVLCGRFWPTNAHPCTRAAELPPAEELTSASAADVEVWGVMHDQPLDDAILDAMGALEETLQRARAESETCAACAACGRLIHGATQLCTAGGLCASEEAWERSRVAGPSAPECVYLVTMYAVYDHGTCGVFTTREAAEAWIAELGTRSDGHHDFRINEIPLDHPVEPDGSLRMWAHREVGLKPPQIEFVAWDPDE